MVRKILIATDGSDSAREAVQFGLDLADEHRAIPFVVYVVPAFDLVPLTGFAVPPPKVTHTPSAADRQPLEAAEAVAAEKGIEATTTLLSGKPADEIIAYADTIDADLIVVGSRGHGAITSALLGSVSRGVLHEARRPVLIVQTAPVPAGVL
jgi:nucleotide-binding universal stress UspA family protein